MSEKKPSEQLATQHNESDLSQVDNSVLNADLARVLSVGPQLKPLSANSFKLYAILLVSFMGSLSFGFDTSVISSVNGMIQFTEYFHIGGGSTGGGQGVVTAMLYSIFSFGCIVGSFVAGPVADSHRWGRRGAMFIASIIILAGVSTVTAAQSRIYLFFGRFLIGFGSSLNYSAAPAYVAEMAPPQWRGRLAGLYNMFSLIGSIVCSGLTIATGRFDSSWSWRLPFAMQLVPTTCLAVGVCLIPESPRWLMSVGRNEEARKIVAKYHGNGDVAAPLVLLEYRELEEYIKTRTYSQRAGWRDLFDYSELFSSPTARYRTLLTSWLGLCCQWSGIGMFYYITVVFDLAGVKTQERRLTFSSVAIAMGACGIYPPECLAFATRAKGLALVALTESLASLVSNFAGAVAFQKIGWKYILVPAVWDAVQVFITWSCAVETKGRTLEELDEIFKV
ncbi:hypothetical protein GGX14DRAFT_554401 [Mycena pura]|uniref:Major facilitator superfamily (MFS) profile domain-containing protein n=1 Tax=Mycena pura TaxID=153505 RepID=A0AAD7E4F0_9AGAR|nr:hypothetical protein GGX14DRAFT_554401 [Mycena pura]